MGQIPGLLVLLGALALACGDDADPTGDPDAGLDAGDAEADGRDGGPADAGRRRMDGGSPPPPPIELGRHQIEVVDTRLVVPSDGLPMEATVDKSNNNLDVIEHDGRVYLAWRTAPDHFAGTETVIEVISSEDERVWRHETTVSVGTDLREPRFIEVGGTLFLFISQLGTDRFNFEPQGVGRLELRGDGTWSEWARLEAFDRYITWRTKVEAEVPYMVAYRSGGDFRDIDAREPNQVGLLTTTDGLDWLPVNPARPFVHEGGGGEADFTFLDDGRLVGVIRNEGGTDGAFGSLICQAPAGDITDWSCVNDRKKYDSPLAFSYDGEAYLVGRRTVTDDGYFDLEDETLDFPQNALAYQIAYLDAPKRCSLWRFIREGGSVRVGFVLDLPSRGDTCFAGVLRSEVDNEIVLYNYSSPIDGPDLKWGQGQVGDTYIYRHVLRFTSAP